MQRNEQQLIESLFTRLKQAETQSGPRDAAAEQLIQQQIQQQPGAPYYMAQSILIQEAAMKQLTQRVSDLEAQLSQARQPPQQSRGGFLSGLFGGNQPQQPPQQTPIAGNGAPHPAWGTPPAAAPSASRGFLGGALQTAVGVAGGVVMADMLTSMFHHTQPEEIVNIINEPAASQDSASARADTFNNDSGEPFVNQDAGLQQADTSNYDDVSGDDFGFGGDDFGDDDSFV